MEGFYPQAKPTTLARPALPAEGRTCPLCFNQKGTTAKWLFKGLYLMPAVPECHTDFLLLSMTLKADSTSIVMFPFPFLNHPKPD